MTPLYRHVKYQRGKSLLSICLAVGLAMPIVGCGKSKAKEESAMSVKGSDDLTGKKVLFIIAGSNFRDEELLEPRNLLTECGADITIVSSRTGTVRGMLGASVTVEMTLRQVKADQFDAVIFVGGSGASEYFENPTAHRLAQDAASAGKLVAAICIAPSTLANAGLLKGRKATCYSSQAQHLKQQGANYTSQPVVEDGNIITADGPTSAGAFGQAIAAKLAGK